MVKLASDEQEMFDGKHGRAQQRAMEILVQYADALGAERFVDTNNVHVLIGFHPCVSSRQGIFRLVHGGPGHSPGRTISEGHDY